MVILVKLTLYVTLVKFTLSGITGSEGRGRGDYMLYLDKNRVNKENSYYTCTVCVYKIL